MQLYRNHARFIGLMYILAMAASIAGGLMIQRVLDQTPLLPSAARGRGLLTGGAALEFLNILCTFSISFALWTPLRTTHPTLATAYVGMRALEAMVFLLAMAVPVSLLTLSGGFPGITAEQSAAIAQALVLLRTDNVAILGPLVFSASALLLYTALYLSRLVPRYLSVWGFIASLGIAAMNLLGMDTALKPIAGLPMILNELWLGSYLLWKGFRPKPPEAAVC